jgi:VIT1/CCC1 family predicted Fe2+/Mn2+ transporter
MTSFRRHTERHRTDRIGWLRAAVLGANDGIVSTASLVVGVAVAGSSHGNILVTGVAGLVAGAMSMAAGEYVSVHSQADTENADLSRERAELEKDPAAERRELTAIYVGRGLEPGLAQQVAEQLMTHDAIGAHGRDELGISEARSARPIQAALASAGRQLRGRCGAAAGGDGVSARAEPDSMDIRDGTLFPGLVGCRRRACWRRRRF